jgi:molybdopterin-containing oxidoreductase family membrane subunit
MIANLRLVRQEVIRFPLFSAWVGFWGLMFILGLISAANVHYYGLQVTNLTDQVPWGLWITVDLSAIALGAGAFSLSAMAYLLRFKGYEQIARMAVFVGLVGYTSAMLALFMDIGRPERFWHPVVYWNVHSVLWEITLCVILYFAVLVVEFGPILLESSFVSRRFPAAPAWGHRIHRFAPLLAVLGLGISLLHQSSLGATYGVLVARPIWFRPSLPVMFIVSAVAAGGTFTLGLTVLYENLLGRRVIATHTRNSVALFAGLMTLAYLYLKLWDYLATFYYSHIPARTEALALLERATPYGGSFWVMEILIGAFLPALILLWPRLRRQDAYLIVAALLALSGIIVNRWNVTLSGLIVPLDWSPGVAEVFGVNSYQPSLAEWGVSLGVLAYGILMFTLGLRFLPLFPQEEHSHDS